MGNENKIPDLSLGFYRTNYSREHHSRQFGYPALLAAPFLKAGAPRVPSLPRAARRAFHLRFYESHHKTELRPILRYPDPAAGGGVIRVSKSSPKGA